MQKIFAVLLGLAILGPSVIEAKKLDNLTNLNKAVNKQARVYMKTDTFFGEGLVLLTGKVLKLTDSDSTMTMIVETINQVSVKKSHFDILYLVLGDNVPGNWFYQIEKTGTRVQFYTKAILGIEVPRSKLSRWLTFWRPKYKHKIIYARSDVLGGKNIYLELNQN